MPRLALVVLLFGLVPVARDDDPPATLPGTRPLTQQGDLAAQLVEGADRFLLRKTGEAIKLRPGFWNRDIASAEKYAASVELPRQEFADLLGVRVETRPAFDAPELVATTDQPALVGKGQGFEVFAVRWPAFGDVHGEGLLLVPTGRKPAADVVAIPDADQTPEQLVGLVEGIAPASQYARRLAESGCRVIVPTLIDRRLEARNGRSKLTTREFLYRPAFEMGRHLIGYEILKVLAAVDWFVRDAAGNDPKIGVIGWGEGGLVALYAAALDVRIDGAVVSGYFNRRKDLWQEPLDRNVFGLLEKFGDAEIASLVAPRALVVEASQGPEVLVAPGNGGGPGRITTPELTSVLAEFQHAQQLVQGLEPKPELALSPSAGGRGPCGTEPTLRTFLFLLNRERAPAENLTALGPAPQHLRPRFDPEVRQQRQVHELDRHTQQLLDASAGKRQALMQKSLDTSSPEAYQKSTDVLREVFRKHFIGWFPDPLLPADVRTRRVYDEPRLTGYEVVMDVFPDVVAYGILLVPKDIKEGERRPVVVCQHGLEGRPQDVADPKVDNPAYNQYAVKLAERGFVTFAPQNLYIGQDRFRTLQRKANPLGKTLFSIIVPQHQQITNWLKTQPFVDPERIAFYGLSYGGKSAMRIPPLVSNYCLSICSADFNEWVWKNASTRSPYSYVWTGEYEIFEWNLGSMFNYAEMAALIAPRPFMVERGHFDGVAPDEMVAYEFAKVRQLYDAKLRLPPGTCRIEFFVGPHTIHGVGTFDFLHEQLQWPRP